MRVDARLVSEDVHKRDRVAAYGMRRVLSVGVAVVHADEVLVAERPGRCVRAACAHSAAVRLALGEGLLRRDAAHLRHAVVVALGGIDEYDRSIGASVVRSGHGNVQARARHGAAVHLHERT